MARRTQEELDALAIIDPEIDAIWKSDNKEWPRIDFSDSAKSVMQLRILMGLSNKIIETPDVINDLSNYTTRDGHVGRLLVFRPSSSLEVSLPLLVHIHGGGGAVGSPESTARFCQSLCLKQNCVVVSVEYRLAPEYKFPTGVHDTYDAVIYLSSHSEEIGADLALGFVIGGHSFGATCAILIALHAGDDGLNFPITGLYLSCGSYIDPDHMLHGYATWLASRYDPRCLNSMIYNEQTKRLFDESYGADKASPWYRAANFIRPTPVNLARGHQLQMPRIYLQTCGMDILRDDSFIYEDMLKKDGIPTKLDVYPGCPHMFWTMFGPGVTTQGTRWHEDTQNGVSWVLGK